MLNLELQDAHKINALIGESKKFNIILQPPCINASYEYFTKSKANPATIVFGFGAIKKTDLPTTDFVCPSTL